jgi:hypothetical protein
MLGIFEALLLEEKEFLRSGRESQVPYRGQSDR